MENWSWEIKTVNKITQTGKTNIAFFFSCTEHTHIVLVNSLLTCLDLEFLWDTPPGTSVKMFPGRFKWEKTHSGSGHIIPQVSGAGLKKEKEKRKRAPGFTALCFPDRVAVRVENIKVETGDYQGRKTTGIVLLDCQLGGITNFWARLWGSFYTVLIEVDKLTLNMGTSLPELGSQIKQESKLSTNIHFSARWVWTQCESTAPCSCHVISSDKLVSICEYRHTLPFVRYGITATRKVSYLELRGRVNQEDKRQHAFLLCVSMYLMHEWRQREATCRKEKYQWVGQICAK